MLRQITADWLEAIGRAGKPEADYAPARGTGKENYRPDIDGLRAIAVLAVLAFHGFPEYFPGGFVGVDIFFVISGFLISGIIIHDLRSNSFNVWTFYARRIRRILPALLMVLVASLALGWRILSYEEYKLLGKHVAGATGFFVNFQLLKEAGYFDTDAALKPLLHLWSLGVEEQFYLVWPFLLMIAWRFKKIGLVIVAVLVCSFLVNITLVEMNEIAAFYRPSPRFWELMLGALLAFAHLNKKYFFEEAADMKAWLGLAFIGISFAVISEERTFPGYWALLPTFGTLLLISAGEKAWLNRVILSSRPFVFCGLISYALYLWHWPLLSFARIAAKGDDLAASSILLLLALGFVLACATYFFVEKPLRTITWPEFRRRWAPGLLASTLLLGVAGATIPKSGWALLRFPAEVRDLLMYNSVAERKWGKGEGCFLRAGEGPSHFKSDCVDPPSAQTKPLLLLWGDSHAAQLVSGLKKMQSENRSFRFAHFTAAGCPPVITEKMIDRENCVKTNKYVVNRIAALKPDILVMAGFWYTYGLQKKTKRLYWKLDSVALADTVRLARRAGAKKVIFVGETPAWKIFQPIISAELLVSKGNIPERTSEYLDSESLSVDDLLRLKVTEAGAIYIRPSKYLCAEDGCVIKTAEGPAFFDKDHLTEEGSFLLLRPMLQQLELRQQRPDATGVK